MQDVLSKETAAAAGCAVGTGAGAAGAAAKSSSIPSRSTTGAGWGALVIVGVTDVGAAVADLRGTGEDREPETLSEFDLRTAEVSSSPASYSSYPFLESRKLLLPPPL